MAIHQIAGLDIGRWETWVVPVVGLLSAGLVFALTKLLSRQPNLAEVASTVPQGPDPFEGGSLTERRTAPRRTGRPLRVLINDDTMQSKAFEGWVMDRSMGGLCIMTDRSINRNIVLNVRAAEADESVPWV